MPYKLISPLHMVLARLQVWELMIHRTASKALCVKEVRENIDCCLPNNDIAEY